MSHAFLLSQARAARGMAGFLSRRGGCWGLAAFVLCCSGAAPRTTAQSTSIVIEMQHPFCPDVSMEADAEGYEGYGYLTPIVGEAGCCGQVCTFIPNPNHRTPTPNPQPPIPTPNPEPQPKPPYLHPRA